MNKEIILLDTGPLGQIINPKDKSEEGTKWREWFDEIAETHEIYIPEIADYEIRRKLLHKNLVKSLIKLDELIEIENIFYLCITTEIIKAAAELWALERKKGQPNSSEKALDGDVILIATAVITSKNENKKVIIATGDNDIRRYVDEDDNIIKLYKSLKQWENDFWLETISI